MELLVWEFVTSLGETLAHREEKHARVGANPTKPNWPAQEVASDQSPISHTMGHPKVFARGDTSADHVGAPTLISF